PRRFRPPGKTSNQRAPRALVHNRRRDTRMARSAVNCDAAPGPGAPEFDDIQGMARFGQGHLTAACFFLLRIADLAAAREWLGKAPVTNAVVRDPPPDKAL